MARSTKKFLLLILLGVGFCALPLSLFSQQKIETERLWELYTHLFKSFSHNLEEYQNLMSGDCAAPSMKNYCDNALSSSSFLTEENLLPLVMLISEPYKEDSKTYKEHFSPSVKVINNYIRQVVSALLYLNISLSSLGEEADSPAKEAKMKILTRLLSFHASLYEILMEERRLRW